MNGVVTKHFFKPDKRPIRVRFTQLIICRLSGYEMGGCFRQQRSTVDTRLRYSGVCGRYCKTCCNMGKSHTAIYVDEIAQLKMVGFPL